MMQAIISLNDFQSHIFLPDIAEVSLNSTCSECTVVSFQVPRSFFELKICELISLRLIFVFHFFLKNVWFGSSSDLT